MEQLINEKGEWLPTEQDRKIEDLEKEVKELRKLSYAQAVTNRELQGQIDKIERQLKGLTLRVELPNDK